MLFIMLCQLVSMEDRKNTIKAVHEVMFKEAAYWVKVWAVKKVEIERNAL